MCEEWSVSYLAFKLWALGNGYSEGLQIDRIDNDGNYEPANCRWVTPHENTWNRRSSKRRTALSSEEILNIHKAHSEGASQTEIAHALGVSHDTIWRVVNRRGAYGRE